MNIQSDNQNSVSQMYLDLADVDGDHGDGTNRKSLWKIAVLSTTALGTFLLFNGSAIDLAFAYHGGG